MLPQCGIFAIAIYTLLFQNGKYFMSLFIENETFCEVGKTYQKNKKLFAKKLFFDNFIQSYISFIIVEFLLFDFALIFSETFDFFSE